MSSTHISGLYNRLVSVVPAAETNEVTSVLGVALVDSIYSKWTELNILIEIVNDSINDSNNKHNSFVYSKLTVFGSTYNNEISTFIDTNRRYLNIASIAKIKSDVVRLLKRENDALECDITSLNALIEREMDSQNNHFDISHTASKAADIKAPSSSSSSRDNDQCSTCSARVKSSGYNSKKVIICIDCKLRIERRERKLADKLPKKGAAASTGIMSSSASTAEMDSVDPSVLAEGMAGVSLSSEVTAVRRAERESKAKSRLQRAKDELYFLDI